MSRNTDIIPTLPQCLPSDWLLDVCLPCPTCGYNLRRLHVPRCPECGDAFRWQTLLQISCPRCAVSLETEDGENCPACGLALDWARLFGERDPSEFTQFEYTSRPKHAAMRVLFSTQCPRRFWQGLRIESPPAVLRLRRFRTGCIALFAAGVAALLAALSALGIRIQDALGQLGGWLIPAFALLVTAGLMPVFTPTLSKFRIRRDQLLRIFAYGASGLAWIGTAYLAFALISLAARFLPSLLPIAVARNIPSRVFPDLLA